MIENTKGQIYYGMHFYPGVAQYQEPGQEPYRVFLNENTIRAMDPTFAGCPIFVEHVDEVDSDINELRKEADGWVIESFFNAADGKHWVKFVVVSEKGEKAIQSGMRLSNAYMPKSFKQGGEWNGVPYVKEITEAEYEHLAIVRMPRYEESVIKTPEEFKLYNEKNILELKKISNSKKGDSQMKLNFFKKTKVENAIDPELQVILPKSGIEKTLTQIINEADDKEMDKNSGLADMSHKVKMHDGSYCNVGELLEKHKAMCDELEAFKKPKEDEKEMDVETKPAQVDSESDTKNDDSDADDTMMDEKEGEKKNLQLDEPKDKEVDEAKKKNAKEKADRLRNAHEKVIVNEAQVVELSYDKLARGKARY